jgi:putative restriction endonuclease
LDASLKTLLAMDLYSRISFGQCNQTNKFVRDLAQKIGRTPSSVARKLGNLARFDPSLQERGVKGLSHGSKLDEAIWNEAHADWSRFLIEAVKVEKEFDFEPPIIPEPILESRTTERLTTVRARVGQQFFRAAVLGSYKSKCSMCGLDDSKFVVASHIKPWALDEENRINPKNGIALCVLHDAAFDGFCLTLNNEFKWTFLKSLKDKFDRNPYDKFFAPYEGVQMTAPDRWSPDAKFIAWHCATAMQI